MKYIVYGIVDAQRAAMDELPMGLNGSNLVAIGHGQLAAILSPLPEELDGSAGIDRALAFAQVVEQLHRQMTILPMRFGCFVYLPEHAAEFLRRHEKEFTEALSRLEGCDEMGLRVLLPDLETNGSSLEDQPPGSGSDTPTGAAYLQARRRVYERQNRTEQACREWAERAEQAFTGLFRESHRECVVRPEGALLSLSFLVSRSRVRVFREAFRRFQLEQDHSVKAICSGPWPPYVFVAALTSGTATQAEKELLNQLKG